MHSDDNDSDSPMSATPPDGMGHDPLEWLQEDEDEVASETVSESPSVDTASTEPTESASAETIEDNPEPVVDTAQPEQAVPILEVQTKDRTPDDNSSQSLTIDNHKAIIRLPEKLSVQIIEPLHTEWKTLFYDLPQSLEIDAGALKDLDAAGMQLLYVLVQQMSFKGCDVVVTNVHANLQRYVKVAGLEEFFTQFVLAA